MQKNFLRQSHFHFFLKVAHATIYLLRTRTLAENIFLSLSSCHFYLQSAQVPVDDKKRTKEKKSSARAHVHLMNRLLHEQLTEEVKMQLLKYLFGMLKQKM